MQKSTEQKVALNTPDPAENSLPPIDTPARRRSRQAALSQPPPAEIFAESFSAAQRKRLDLVIGQSPASNPDLAFSRFIKRTGARRMPNRRSLYSSRNPSDRQNGLIERTIINFFDRLISWAAGLLKKAEQILLGSSRISDRIIQIIQHQALGERVTKRRRLFKRSQDL